MLDRILRGNHKKGLGQHEGTAIDGDLAFVHGFQQRGLRFRGSAVDFVGQKNVGEDRTVLEFELLRDRGIDGNSHNIGRQQVAGELHPLKTAIDGSRDRMSQSRFPHAGNAFNQQVATRQQRNHRQTDDIVLAANHFSQSFFQLYGASRGGGRSFWRHLKILLWARERAAVTEVTEDSLKLSRDCALHASVSKLRRPSRKPFDALGNRRMSREQAAEIHAQ